MKSKRIYDEKMNVLKNIDNIAYNDIKDKGSAVEQGTTRRRVANSEVPPSALMN